MSSHGLTVSQNCLEVFPPLVSVIIPAFNAAETISETLESVLAQSYSNVEIIVVDDGSTDQTQIALAAFGNRVTSIRQANGGLANARNAGCRMARGTFIALMDADDLCVPDRIAIQVEVLASLPNVVLCASDFTTFDRNGPIEEYGAKSYYSKIQQAPQGLISLYPEKHVVELRTIPHAVNPLEIELLSGKVPYELACGNFVHPPTIMFHREILAVAGEFDESLPNHSDWEWIVRAAQTGEFAHVVLPLLMYRISPTQRSGPSRRCERALDLVNVAKKICLATADAPAAYHVKINESLAEISFDAADAIADTQKLKACVFFFEGLSWPPLRITATYRIAAKILTPMWFIAFIRRWRTRRQRWPQKSEQ